MEINRWEGGFSITGFLGGLFICLIPEGGIGLRLGTFHVWRDAELRLFGLQVHLFVRYDFR